MKPNVIKLIALTLLMSFITSSPIYAENLVEESVEYYMEVSDVIPQEATEYIEYCEEDICNLAKIYKEELDIESSNMEEISIGTPFVIFDLDDEQQDEIYYYPILDSEENFILVASVMGTTEGWALSFSTELVEQLDEISYEDTNYVFVESEDNVIAVNEEEFFVLEGEETDELVAFANEDYDDQICEITEAIQDDFVSADVSADEIEDAEISDGYVRSYLMNRTDWKVCKLYGKQGQGAYGMCWAATTATIVNYIKGTSYTGKQVCNKMLTGYNSGGSIYKSQAALRKLGVNYNNLNTNLSSVMSWTLIRKNIDKKYPVYISAVNSSNQGHAVTIGGYQVQNSKNYLWIWNPGLNSGNGQGQLVEYKSTGSTFTYGNTTFRFRFSLSMY